ncbi:MAG TPA: ABC transporter ATP-binding protein [Actinocrinis sp.]|uniref:ABC transporter ATP-binding protein n=1 Tax=Actinocrinis sp. TaxID=1920516 RepID=UPI002D50B42B|nr:ABC transporter ATP-binding protein [Actinocrinis sp.]HZU58560.1 ABC transporter ATP-binding protein [Actinocrinis sp.]
MVNFSGAAASATADAAARTAPAPAVDVHDLRVVRGGRSVLKGIGVTIARGTVTGLLGPSGCGKSTLMRAIVGVQKVAAGEVRVLGRPAGDKELRHRVGYVTQAPSVYADLSIAENLRYFAAILGVPRDDVQRVIEQVGLQGRERDLVSRLSGGQRARVSLAAALLGTPELLVLDEPTVGLDPVLRTELWDLFHALAADGATLLISSHVMDEATRCGHLLLMRDGEFIADDTPEALLARTGASEIEAAFLALVAKQSPAAEQGSDARLSDQPEPVKGATR